MDPNDVDKLAFALLTSIKWAVDGGKVEQIPHVHEELTFALDAIFNKVGPELATLKERRTAFILDVLQKNGGNIIQTARELKVSRWTISRATEEKKIA